MKRLFFIAHRLPFPPNKGDKLRAYHILKYLSLRFDEVYLFTHLDDVRDLEEVRRIDLPLKGIFYRFRSARIRKLRCLKALVSGSLTVAYFYEKGIQKAFNRLVREKASSLIFCSCAPSAAYVFKGPKMQTKLLLDFMDVDSEKWQAFARKKRGLMARIYALEAKRLRAFEKKIVGFFDQVFLVSEDEAALFKAKVLASTKVSVLENGVDLSFFSPSYQSKLPKLGKTIVFTGAMDYWPNAEAVLWFARNCWPKIKKAFSEVYFYVVGKDPFPEVKALSRRDDKIIVTGFVPEARDYLALADVCIAPLQIARGVQNKVLEAAAMGKAIVATPQAAEGLNFKEGKEIFVSKDSEDFTQKVLEFLRDQELALTVGQAARQRVEKEYAWEKKLARLEAFLP